MGNILTTEINGNSVFPLEVLNDSAWAGVIILYGQFFGSCICGILSVGHFAGIAYFRNPSLSPRLIHRLERLGALPALTPPAS